MRDLLLLAFLPYAIYLILRRPFIGAALWVWSSLFVPDAWVWGVATSIRYNFTVAVVSIVSYLIYSAKQKPAWSGLATLVIIYYLWFSVSAAFAISDTEVPYFWWDIFSRVIALFLFCQLVLTKKLHWDVFIWAMVLALGGYGMLEGSKYILSGLNHAITGIAGSPMHDRNLLAVGLNMMIPFAVYLRLQVQSRVLKIGLMAMIFLLAVAVVGTFSRGGLVTLVAISMFYLIASGRRFFPALVTLAIVAYGLSFVLTDQYLDRAHTIQSASEDASFLGRTSAWKLSLYIALDRPLFGGGPLAVETWDVWPKYEAIYDPNEYFPTGPYEMATRAAHSIYFQVLGDTGFGGLTIYLLILGSALGMTLRIINYGKVRGDIGLTRLGKALLLSLTAFLIGGAALSMAYFDIVFALLGLIAAVGARCRSSSGRAVQPSTRLIQPNRREHN